jgi:hypothetical protein
MWRRYFGKQQLPLQPEASARIKLPRLDGLLIQATSNFRGDAVCSRGKRRLTNPPC